MVPKLGSYSEKANTLTVEIGDVTFYYSYTTLVAYKTPSEGLVVCENYWSNTTGKHLNEIDGGRKEYRLKKDDFDARLASAVRKHTVVLAEAA
jgi:hypothetical protein